MSLQTDCYKWAWEDISDNFLERVKWENLTYQGKVDVTEHIPFSDVADYWGLSERQYNQLINRAQKVVDEKLTAYFGVLLRGK